MATTAPAHYRRRRLSRRVHGIIDYIFGVLLIALPWIVPFGTQRLAAEIVTTFGLIVLVMSLVTHYELGLVPLLPFRGHLFFDVLIALGLFFAPWQFQIGGAPAIAMWMMGLVALLVAIATESPGPSMNAT